MSALPYAGSAAPLYGGVLPLSNPAYGVYNTGAYNAYPGAYPSYDPSVSYGYPSTTYPSYVPTTVQPATYTVSAPTQTVSAPTQTATETRKEQTVLVRKILTDDSTDEYYRNAIRAVEESVVSTYQDLERQHVAMNQKQSEDYGNIFHLETQEAVKFYQKLDSVKYQLPENIVIEANKTYKIFSDPFIPRSGYPAQQHQVQAAPQGTAPAAGSAPAAGGTGTVVTGPEERKHPMLELKGLQEKVRNLRALLQKEVDKLLDGK